MKAMLITLAVIVVCVLMMGGCYNGLVSRDEQVDAAWAQVETVLQRRYDLIPNLVNTVKGYANHEKEVFTDITKLRSQWGAAKTTGDKVAAANGIEGALSRLLLVAENYPQLKANQNFLALQDELAGTENRIATERRRFNQAVQSYNTAVRTFPRSIFAEIFGFERRDEYFEAAETASEAPQVEF